MDEPVGSAKTLRIAIGGEFAKRGTDRDDQVAGIGYIGVATRRASNSDHAEEALLVLRSDSPTLQRRAKWDAQPSKERKGLRLYHETAAAEKEQGGTGLQEEMDDRFEILLAWSWRGRARLRSPVIGAIGFLDVNRNAEMHGTGPTCCHRCQGFGQNLWQ